MTHFCDEVSSDDDVSVRRVILHVVRVRGVNAAQHFPGEHQLRCLRAAVLGARSRGARHLFSSLRIDQQDRTGHTRGPIPLLIRL